MNFLETRIPPPVVVLIFAIVMRLAAGATPFLTWANPFARPAAVALAALGLLIEGAGVLSFLRARTSVDPTHPRGASQLVTSGIYRFTRNPMYLGDLLLLLAWAVYLSNGAALVMAPCFVPYLNRFQIRPEERAMQELFGAQYSDFKSRVRRWL